jgi:predicted peroxiredoxin
MSVSEPASARAPLPAAEVAGVALLLWAADPEAPERLATPFFHAGAAAAFDVPVEIYFSAGSVRLLVPGVAERLRASAAHAKTILDAMREAVAHGAIFYACADALAAHGLDRAELIGECTRRGGAVQFMARACDPRWRALVF